MKIKLLLLLKIGAGIFFLSGSAVADALDNWHWRNPLPTANSLAGIAYGNGKFVAVGQNGLMLTSLDGLAWDLLPPVVSNSLNRVIFANGGFVTIGDGGAILTSSDGVTWVARNSGLTNRLLAIAYGNGIFMTVGTAGTVLVSSNSTQWSAVNSGVAHDLNWITFGNSQFMLPGPTTSRVATILLTSNGVSWAQFPILPNVDSAVYQVTYGNNQFVAYLNKEERPVGQFFPYFYVSTNGVNWSQGARAAWSPAMFGPYSTFGFLTFANGHLLEVEYRPPFDVAANTWISISQDALTWANSIQLGSGFYSTYFGLSDVSYGAGKYVMVGANGIILASADGTNWTLTTKGGRDRITGIAAGNGVKVAVGGGVPLPAPSPDRQMNGYAAPLLVSSNGSEFRAATSTTTQMLARVAFGSGVFVAVGDGGALQRSTNGTSWTVIPSGTTKDIPGVCWGSNLWVAVAADGVIITSPNGLAWTTRASGTGYSLYGVTYGNGFYVAVGYFGVAATSPDGINWTIQYTGTANTLFNVVYGNGMFVAAGDGGIILTSSDGENWTARSSGTSLLLYGLSFGRGQFVAVGAPGTGQAPTHGNVLLRSFDGEHWQPRLLPTHWGIYSASFHDESFWVSGEYGTVLQSDAIPDQPLLAGRLLLPSGDFELTIFGSIPVTSRLQVCTNLVSCGWDDLAYFTNIVPPHVWTDTNTLNGTMRVYRVASP